MKLFAKSYVSALLVVLLAMGAYRLVVVTAIEPSAKPTVEIPEFTGVLSSGKWWQGLFRDGAWQVEKPIVIQNGRGVLLANSWEQIGPKTFKFQPLSMILPQSGSAQDVAASAGMSLEEAFAQQDVWIVSAEAGAIIHFEEPFDLTSGTVPAIERGQLDGAISITRRCVTKPDDKPWSLKTSDLSIDRRRISTQQAVAIEWGNSTIRGRDLRIMLRRDVLGGKDGMDDPSAWGPLDELELYHVDELKVALPPGGLWAGVSPSLLPNGTPKLDNLPATLEAFCGGRFAFDFKQSMATLTNGVHIKHRLADLPPDEFLSHKVTIKVDPPSAGETQTTGVSMGGIQIREVVALGIDSLQNFVGEKWVELKSPTLGAAARAKRLRVNLDQQRIELAGKLDQPGATQSIAWLTYQGNEYRSPSIAYQASPQGADGKTLHAGWMYADGPGELTTSASSSVGESQVRWQRSLTMEPSEAPGEQKLELLGKTLVENKQHGFMTADRLQLWLKRNPPLTDGNDSGDAKVGFEEDRTGYLPDRVMATGNTTLATGDLKAHVGSLFLKMMYIPATSNREPQGLQLSDSLGNPMYQFASPPEPGTATLSTTQGVGALPGSSQPFSATKKSGQPVTIHGSSLNATVLSAGNQNWVDALTIDGPLKIVRETDAAADSSEVALPWHIEGDQLKLATNADGQVDLQIEGKPAKVVMAEGALEGPVIRLDQRHNLVWMDQPGEFTLPISALNQNESSNGGVRWGKSPHCTWQGRLLFDGSMVHIEGDIQLDGVIRRAEELWILQGFCQRLDLVLAEAIDMRQMRANVGAMEPSVERIVLQDNVDLRIAQTDLKGNRQSLERIVVPILTFHVTDQKLVGGGAGWINSKFIAKNGSGTALGQSSTDLQGAHLSFRDSLVAFLDRHEVVFDGKVELASGPLNNWDDTINLAQLTQLTLDQMLLNCDQLKLYDTSGLSSTASFAPAGEVAGSYNFQALGNVVFEGRAETAYYAGNGYRLTYEQAKDQLIIVGDGRTPALLKKIPIEQLQGGAAPQGTLTAYVNSATVNVKTMAVIDLQASQVQYDAPQPGQPVSSATAPSLPSMTTPNPRAGVSNFLQPRR